MDKNKLVNDFVVELFDKIENGVEVGVVANAKAYAEVFKEEFEKFKSDNKIKDNNLAIASFFNAEREKGLDSEDFSIKMKTATLYKQLRDNNFEEMYVKNVPAYAEIFKDDLNKYMKEHNITDKNIGIAKFYIYDSERLKGTPEFSDRIKTAVQYRLLKEEKTPHLPGFCACPRCGNTLVKNNKFTNGAKNIKGTTVECGVCHLEIDVVKEYERMRNM